MVAVACPIMFQPTKIYIMLTRFHLLCSQRPSKSAGSHSVPLFDSQRIFGLLLLIKNRQPCPFNVG